MDKDKPKSWKTADRHFHVKQVVQTTQQHAKDRRDEAAKAVDDRTARLRAQRLARDASEAEAPVAKAPSKTKNNDA